MQVGFIGYGEVASTLSQGLMENGADVYTCILGRGTKTTEMAVYIPLVIENMGIDDLYVRKILNNTKFITVDAYNKPIKAGEKAQINIVVNLKGRSGKIDRVITLVTNDADNSYVEIHITGVVENY